MATKKNGVLTVTGKWWKHLRWTKRYYWKGERKAGRGEIAKETSAAEAPRPRKSMV